jgi:hypothetical protein
MGLPIEVRVHGQGSVAGDHIRADIQTEAACALCGRHRDAVASLGDGRYACADCMRERLEAMSVARWRLREGSGLPWGKISG